MAGSAEGHQILSCMSAALRNRDLVMHLCCRDNSAILLALLTKRVMADVAVTNPFPGSAILLVDVRGAFVFVVLPSGNSGMIFTVLSIRQPGTAGIVAGAFRFTWHICPPSSVVAVACTG